MNHSQVIQYLKSLPQVHLKYYKRCFIKSLIQLYLVLLFVYLYCLLHPCNYPCFILYHVLALFWASQVMLVVKNLPANAGDTRNMGSISGSGRSPGEGNSSPLQYSCLENPMDGGAWQSIVCGVAESDTTERLHFLSFFSLQVYKWIFLPCTVLSLNFSRPHKVILVC